MADISTIELGFLLCGGASKRYGSPKLGALLEGETLLDRAIRIHLPLVEELFVLSAAGESYLKGSEQVRVIEDNQPYRGPLPSLRSAMYKIGQIPRRCLVIAADMPGLLPAWADILVENKKHFDAVVPMIGNQAQPLAALYGSSAWQKLMEHPELKSMHDWLSVLQVNYLTEEYWQKIDVTRKLFCNINTKEDLNQFIRQDH